MRLPLAARIAWRYLRAKKSHSAVGAISMVSVCGIAVATTAIICVLSVFNGFRSVIADRLDTLSPDVMVTPAQGKTFADGDSLAEAVRSVPEVEEAIPSVFENALVIFNGHEIPVFVKGVDMPRYARITSLRSLLLNPDSVADAVLKVPAAENTAENSEDSEEPVSVFDEPAETPKSIIAVGTAARLGAYPGDSILLFTPRREGRINLANPAASFLQDSALVAGVYQSNQSDYDDNRVIVDIDVARQLLQYDLESSAIEIKGKEGVSPERLARKVGQRLGPGYVVKDRLQQQEMNFKMITIEKWVTFLLLFFILVIASFNIISSLSMLVLDKQKSILTLRALGMSRRSAGKIFSWESFFVTLTGGAAGIILGIILCLLQEHYGFIKLQGDPGALVVKAYPVVVKATDVAVTAIPLVVVGAVTAWIASSFARSRAGTR